MLTEELWIEKSAALAVIDDVVDCIAALRSSFGVSKYQSSYTSAANRSCVTQHNSYQFKSLITGLIFKAASEVKHLTLP